jgi:hypothetical protein
MAKFKQNNVELRDNQKLIFDSAKNKYMSYDGGELLVTTNISGVEPTEDYHLGTKLYVDTGDSILDTKIDTTSGTLAAADTAVSNAYIAADVVLDTKIDTTSGTLQTQVDNVSSIFGSEHGYNSSEAESSTTNTSPQEKVTLALTSLPSGTYRIDYSFEGSADDDKDSVFSARVQIDDTTTICEAVGTAALKGLADYWSQHSGFYEVALSGDVDIDIDYWDLAPEAAPVGVNIRRARLSVFRIV